MKELFSGDLAKAQVHLFDDGNTITMIKTTPFVAPATAAAPTEASKDTAGLKNALSRKMMDAILKKMEEETKVKIYSSAMQE
jgi:hypothetical protein